MNTSAAHKLWTFARCAADLGDTPGDRLRILWRFSKNIRARLGVAHYHPDRVVPLRTRAGTLYLRDNFGDITNLPDLVWRCVYRVDGLATAGDVVDVGGNIGLFAAWMARHNPGRRIFCVEPLSSNVEMIRRNCPAAHVTRAGLGRARGRATLQVDAHKLMASSIPTPWPTTDESFDIIPLDEFSAGNGIERVAFLKIDTEGMELDVLDGGRSTLARTERAALETHGRERHEGAKARLREAGLTIDAEEFTTAGGLLFASRR